MELGILIVNILLTAIMFAIFGVWIYLLTYLIKSYERSPRLKCSDKPVLLKFPKVSVILPARNEETYIARCLDSLLNQDYPNFEIVAINDSSCDDTGDIILRYSRKYDKIIAVDPGPKPDGWVGKSWACYQGYRKATGDLLLFTDADTQHSSSLMTLAVGNLLEQNLDAITAVPRLLCIETWTKITLPMLSTFLHTRFSALRVNDPKTKIGYFFGSFFVISRTAYEKVGTHEGVKQELVEDGALGGKVKDAKFRLKMVRGEENLTAIWARDLNSLWQGLRRLMIPLYTQHKTKTTLMIIAVFFMLFEPFIILPYSSLVLYLPDYRNLMSYILVFVNILTILLIILSNIVHSKLSLHQSPIYALASPIAAGIISLSFISSILDAKKTGAVIWRDRQYTITEHQQHPLS
ncbi:MAG: glycosyltransferase [Candidatus Nitrosopolaris sp.]|jgi:chlorobactene glucosyltransferase